MTSFNFVTYSEESQDDKKKFQKKEVPDNYLICWTIYEKQNLLIHKAYKTGGEDFNMAILKHASNDEDDQ